MLRKNGDFEFFEFSNFSKFSNLRHCLTTRLGGVSTGNYKSLNLALKGLDSKQNVIDNYNIVAQKIGFCYDNIVVPDQVHKNNIHIVTSHDLGKGVFQESNIKEVDSLITNQKNIVITTYYADCVPIFFYDDTKKVIAVAHSGWKGTLIFVAKLVVEKMQKTFGCNPKDIVAGIGPSICQKCFEIGQDVYSQFENTFENIKKYSYYDNTKDKFFVDLWQINKDMLVSTGVLAQNIEISNFCTMCREDLFFSHRKMGNSRGSQAGFLELI